MPPPESCYYLYVGNWGSNEVFVVDTDSNIVVDTLRGFDNYIWELVVTCSGAKLYVCTREGPYNTTGKVFSVDLCISETSVIWSGIASDVFVAPDGEVFIISYEPHPEGATEGITYIGIIDTLSEAITFIDTLDIRNTGYNYQSIVFDRNLSMMYGVTNENRLFSYDYSAKTVVQMYHNSFNPLHMTLSPGGDILYCTAMGNLLVVFDLERDSILTIKGANQLGSLALCPEGEYLYITDPGKYMIPEPVPSGKIGIFQTSTNSYIDYIDVNKISGEVYTITDRIVLKPDGRTAYVSKWLDAVFVIDLQFREVTEIINLYPCFPVPMTLGLKK